ncbi:MAG: hypothetical protein H6Q59_1495 [Firmicutes bacterium]|nr:hypothetical protein [Bacillota bacterium]
MSVMFYVILFFVIGSLLMSMFRNQGKSYRDRRPNNYDRNRDVDQTMFTGAADLNFNGVPDYMEAHTVDSDHDGIPDNIDPNPYSFDNSNDTVGLSDHNDFSSGNDFNSGDLSNGSMDAGSFDTGSSFDSGSFDSGSSFDTGSSDFGGGQ